MREREREREKKGVEVEVFFFFVLFLLDALSPNSSERLLEDDRPATQRPHSYPAPVGEGEARAVLVEGGADHFSFSFFREAPLWASAPNDAGALASFLLDVEKIKMWAREKNRRPTFFFSRSERAKPCFFSHRSNLSLSRSPPPPTTTTTLG